MVEHHYSEEELEGEKEIIRRFLDQGSGAAQPSFPHGKLNEQDEGALAFAIAADPENEVVRIDFNKMIGWLAMNLESAQKFRSLLDSKIAELCENRERD